MDIFPELNPENLNKAGELAKQTASGLKLFEIARTILGEQAAMYLFRRKTSLEADRARQLAEVELTKNLLDKSISSFAETEEGKHVLNAVGAAFAHQQLRKFDSISNVFDTAFEQLEQEGGISDEPIDQDWMSRFFNCAGDVSDDEMQKLWGRILAGEIARPKSYSLRTLEFLKNISKDEAELISKLAKLTFTVTKKSFLIGRIADFDKRHYGLNYADILQLEELNVIQSTNLQMTIPALVRPSQIDVAFVQGKRMYNFVMLFNDNSVDTSSSSIKLPVISLTTIGHELCQLMNPETDVDFIYDIESKIRVATKAHHSRSLVSDEYIIKEKGKREYGNLRLV